MHAKARLVSLLVVGLASAGCSEDLTASDTLAESEQTSEIATGATTTVGEDLSGGIEEGSSVEEDPVGQVDPAEEDVAGSDDPATESIEILFTSRGVEPNPAMISCVQDGGFDPASADEGEVAVRLCAFEDLIRTDPTSLPVFEPLDQAGTNCLFIEGLKYLATLPTEKALELLDIGVDHAVGYATIPNAAALEANCNITGEDLAALFVAPSQTDG